MSDHGSTSMTPAPARWRGLRRAGVLAVVASFVGIWGYVLWLSVVQGRPDPRDRLDDTGWAATAEATCARSAAALADLPFASDLATPADRADVLDVATAELEIMVRRLDGLVGPRTPDEAAAVERWLADWTQYLADRSAYAERFRAGLDEPFRVTDRGGFQIDVLIDDFATVNFMPSCATPDDV